jgi:exodeoxyribonuclease VII large subunit/exodeoxyribonuclease VII small subunit
VGEHDRALTVSELLALARRALEPLAVTVVGEVTELTDRPGYKAVYFTLADDDAVLPCLVWRDAYERSACSLRCGMLVQATGAMTVYAPKGRMQFQVRTLAQAGEGLLRVQVAELARRLSAEGLMDPSRKRAVPAFPERVGVVTSPRGKAVHDVVRTLGRRFPAAEIVFAGVSVEGAEAVSSLMRGLAAVAGAGVDVMILARGGGSYEDLMPFNTEALARAIAECPVPVVTGIGHEPDTTIADMVADLRASTPTAAAEAVTPSCADVSSRIDALARTVGRAFLHEVRSLENRVRLAERSPVLADAHGWLALRSRCARDGACPHGRGRGGTQVGRPGAFGGPSFPLRPRAGQHRRLVTARGARARLRGGVRRGWQRRARRLAPEPARPGTRSSSQGHGRVSSRGGHPMTDEQHPDPAQMRFGEALAELEAIVAELESGRLELEEALDSYQRGVALLEACRARLEDAEQRVTVLMGAIEEDEDAT